MLELVLWLLVGHAVADFCLQTEFIAKGKNRKFKPEYIPPGQTPQKFWFYCLGSHALTHGGAVALATGSPFLGCVETAAHFAIDFCKCENWYGIHADQVAHLACKGLYVAYFAMGGVA